MSETQRLNRYTGRPFGPAYYAMRRQTADLPVSLCMPQLLEAIRNNSITIIVGETGSGKSTQIPKCILESLSKEFTGNLPHTTSQGGSTIRKFISLLYARPLAKLLTEK